MQPIHPFPARMAPDLSRELLSNLAPGSRVLDPMCGSGTVVRQAVEAGHDCVGHDLDPLAVLMTRAWTSPIPTFRLIHDAHEIVQRAKTRVVNAPFADGETAKFASYWFADTQARDLARLASAIRDCRFATRDLLRICFSRLIVTKDRGASLARDVSHSRPHRVTTTNDFDVFAGFVRAARLVASRMSPENIRASASVSLGDARSLDRKYSREFDAAMTSPPYLNAIDYLRGHRLALIWFGYSVSDLQRTRARSTGAERALEDSPFDIDPFVSMTGRSGDTLGSRYRGWVRRYATDMTATLKGLRTVVRSGGRIMLVVGNSSIRGASIDNAGIIRGAAETVGLSFISSREREIPARRRYLPTPNDGSPLALRMRTESVLTFSVP